MLTSDMKFCSNCGAAVGQKAAEPEIKVEPEVKAEPEVKVAEPEVKAEHEYKEHKYVPNAEATYSPEPEPKAAPEPINIPVGPHPKPTNVLVWGILGLAFACTWVFSFLGIIFSAVAKSKAKAYLRSGAAYSTQVKVGKNLATGGLIAGIILSVFWVLYIFIIVIAVVAAISMDSPEYVLYLANMF